MCIFTANETQYIFTHKRAYMLTQRHFLAKPMLKTDKPAQGMGFQYMKTMREMIN